MGWKLIDTKISSLKIIPNGAVENGRSLRLVFIGTRSRIRNHPFSTSMRGRSSISSMSL